MTTQKRYGERLSSGKCSNCGKERTGHFKYCEACLERGKARYRRNLGKERPKTTICKTCKTEFDVVGKTGVLPFYCLKCRKEHDAAFLKRWSQNPDIEFRKKRRMYKKEYARQWRDTKHHVYLDTNLRRIYGISLEDYLNIYTKQGGNCAVCKVALPNWDVKGKARKNMHLDHNHENDVVRGILCSNCNMAIGLLKDDPNIVESAFLYLSSFK